MMKSNIDIQQTTNTNISDQSNVQDQVISDDDDDEQVTKDIIVTIKISIVKGD